MLIVGNTNTFKLLVKKADEESAEKSTEKSTNKSDNNKSDNNKSDNNKSNKKSNDKGSTLGNIATGVAAITAGQAVGLGTTAVLQTIPLTILMSNPESKNTSLYYKKFNDDISDLIKLKDAMEYKGNTNITDMEFMPVVRKRKILNDNNINISPEKYKLGKLDVGGVRGARAIPAMYSPTKVNEVYIPLKNKYIAAHEYGHLTGNNILTRTKAAPAIILPNRALPLLAPILGTKYDSNKSFSEQDTGTKIITGATGIAGASAGLLLAEEARASIRAARKLKEIGVGTYRGAIKELLPAFSTYGIFLGLTPYVGYKVAKKTKEKINEYRNKKDDRDNSEVTTHDIQES